MARRKTIVDAFKALDIVDQRHDSLKRTVMLTNIVLFSVVGLLVYSTFFV